MLLPMRVEARALAEAAPAFKGLAGLAGFRLTSENKAGTLHHLQRRLDVMIAALGTLPFLATLWLLVILGAQVLEESGAKIAAALKGNVPQETGAVVVPMRLRANPRTKGAIRVQPRWRAAA
jgi:hypothetical protein